MNSYHRLALLGLLLAIALLSASCASKRPMVNAGRYPQFSPTPTNTLALTTKLNPSPQDAELGRILVEELNHEGFNLVPFEKADYILTYVVEDNWTEDQQQSTSLVRPMPPSQTTSKLLTGTQQPEFSPSTVTTTFVSHSNGIRLVLYTNPKTRPGGLKIAWQGSIDPGKNISSANKQSLIRTLLGHFGQDYNGPVNLAE